MCKWDVLLHVINVIASLLIMAPPNLDSSIYLLSLVLFLAKFLLSTFYFFLYNAHFLGSQSKVLERVDFVICVGGDGTLLYTSSMFQVDPTLI